jgi:methionine-gamma-lyase
MLGYGYDPALSEGAVKPPVFLTSTFVFRSAEEGRDFFDYTSGRKAAAARQHAGLVYSRFNHPNSEIVEDRLAVYEGAETVRRVRLRHGGDHHDHSRLRPAR